MEVVGARRYESFSLEGCQCLTQLVAVCRAEVDLVFRAVHPKRTVPAASPPSRSSMSSV